MKLLLFVLFVIVMAGHDENDSEDSHDNNKRYLISDQYNNRVIVVKRDHSIVWQFGDGSAAPGPTSVVGPNDAQTIGDGRYLISGTGVPSGSPETACPNGCADNRVLVVNQEGHIVWQYGTAGGDELNTPVQATWIAPHSVLITDQGNHRVILVNQQKQIVWQYGLTGTPGSDANELNNPNSAEKLENGHILIADEGNNRVIEVKPENKKIVWQFPVTTNTNPDNNLNAPAFASRLPNGHTLISDSVNNRIIEVNSHDQIVWTYPEPSDGTTLNVPTRAVRLHNGNTLISDQNNNRVIEINQSRHIVFTQGSTSFVAGNAVNELNGPYDAKVIGDFTGLTPPDN